MRRQVEYLNPTVAFHGTSAGLILTTTSKRLQCKSPPNHTISNHILLTMVRLSTYLSLASIVVSCALAAPLRGPKQPRIFLTPEGPAGQPAVVVTYEGEESAPKGNFMAGFGQPSSLAPSYIPFGQGLPMERVVYSDERAVTSGGLPFVFGSSRLGGQSLTEKLLKFMGLMKPIESSFAISGPTRVLYEREDHKDDKPKQEKPKTGIAAIGDWFNKIGQKIKNGFETLIHPHKNNKNPKPQHKPTATSSHSSLTSVNSTSTQKLSTAPTPSPAAEAQARTPDKPEEPAAPQTAKAATPTITASPPEPTA
ncbi:hypothetical protein CPB83DRAFT_861643 [Crepidotus variabilis]|uniref:Uncharacterized protein n=1 Tax=Crepidotus variabilis TaxID=179855 RepID=A0A9P6E811_9AGAR|nr:hypothetical protein CPB83DRAFT_861643 [Crepidotus variabilis]